MAEIDITKMSSKGQVVIPQDMRGDIKEGDKLVVIRNGDQLILKKASKFDAQLADDLAFATRTEAAYKRHELGYAKTMDLEDFKKELQKW